MRWKWLRRLQLAHALLLLLVPLLLLLTLAEIQVAARDVQDAADSAYDRSLLGALKTVDASVSTQAGGLSLELPYHLFDFFQLTASGPVYYRVATGDQLVELGSADLPQPPQPLVRDVPQFYDGTYFGVPVRLVAYMRELPQVEGSTSKLLIVQLAEGTRARSDFKRKLIAQTVASNLGFLALTVACSVAAVIFVLQPVAGLSRELAARKADDMAPLRSDNLPADVRPLVEGMNAHMLRAEALAAQQRDFLDDASHQLRTHLTTMRMQVEFAARESDPAQVHEAVTALGAELQRSTRTTHQLLSLARSDAVALQPEWFELQDLLANVVREFLPAARSRGLDLGIEGEAPQAWGDAELLHEALANLVANAIAYVPSGSVTLRATADGSGWRIDVEDTGPGVPMELISAAGRRFVRNSRNGGSGLGLSIVRSIAARHGGMLRLQAAASRHGLRASLWWPRPSPSHPEA